MGYLQKTIQLFSHFTLHYTYAAELCLTEAFQNLLCCLFKIMFNGFCALVFGNKNISTVPSVSDLFHNNQELNGHDYFLTRESTTISTTRPNAFDRVILVFFIYRHHYCDSVCQHKGDTFSRRRINSCSSLSGFAKVELIC